MVLNLITLNDANKLICLSKYFLFINVRLDRYLILRQKYKI